MNPLPGPPQWSPYGKRCPFQSLFFLSFRVPSKGAHPAGSLQRASIERDKKVQVK